MDRATRSPLFRYSIAGLAAVLATVIRMALHPVVGTNYPYFACYLAVVFVAWFAGLGPALLAVVLGGLGACYFFVPPEHSLLITSTVDLIGIASYLLVSLTIATGLAKQRDSRRRAQADEALAKEQRQELSMQLLDRDRVEEAVAQLGAIVQSSNDAIVSKSLHGDVQTWNPGAERLYGYSAQEMIGRPISLLLPPDSVDEETQILEKIRRGEQIHHYEAVRITKDRRLIDVSLTISPIFDKSGRIIGASHIARDITERKASERERERLIHQLETERARLDTVLQQIPLGVALAEGPSGNILITNNQFHEILGHRLSTVNNLQEFADRRAFHLDGRPYEPPEYPLARSLQTGELVADEELEYIRGDNRRIILAMSCAPIRDRNGQIIAGVAILRDITERKRLDEQLRETQKLESLGLLAGGVAHDFNNLLTGILGNATLAYETVSSTDPLVPLLEHVIRAAQRAAELIKQLLAYSGKGRFNLRPLNLSELVRDISSLIQSAVPKNVQLRLDLRNDVPPIEADPAQMQQLIMNLIINGAEAIEPETNGVVLVTSGVQQVDSDHLPGRLMPAELTPDQYVYVEVQDTGCGMDDETKSKIFDPFFTTKFAGRGLGLAAVSGIVRGHNGAIQVSSTPGEGTTFRVLFPASQQQIPAAQAVVPRTGLSGTGTVLVVDDEEVVRRTAKAALERYGYTVLLAENGQVGVDVFRHLSDRITLVLLDMTMPVLGGEETLTHLRRIRPDVKVLLSSGYSEVEAVRRFSGKGLAGFIQKPYTAADLAASVQQALLP
jgi:two-component system cell cycle sensor histidine kinase/response regulator CckA